MPDIGRPRALDEFKRREVCALVATGCGIDGAARYVGVNPTTIRREALRNPDFHEKLRNAELANELEPLRAMRRAAATHWRAAAWLLERSFPDRFARRDPDSLSRGDLDEIMVELCEQLCDELPDNEIFLRVMRRIQEMATKFSREERAATHTRRNPHRRLAADRTTYPPPANAIEQIDIGPASCEKKVPNEQPTAND